MTLIPWVILIACDSITTTDNLLDIPDYPPPTFQEATSGLALQIPATVLPTASVTDSSVDADAHEDENEPQAGPSRRSEQFVQQSASATSDSDSSSSHSSQDFCDLPSDETAPSTPRKKPKESQRGLAFPSTPLRGRNKSRAAHDHAEADELEAQPVAATRRHNSLSPLRIFPSLHLALHDRAATAHPTTEHASTSPYQHSRGMSSFFRSTTSLALLHGNGNTTPTTLKSKSSITNLSSNGTSPKRKLFSPSKGKERAERTDRPEKVEIDPEIDQLDTWEVIDATEAQGADASAELKTNKDKKEERRRNPDQTADVPTVEPFKGQTEATSTASVSTPVEVQAQRSQPPPVQTQQPSVHPLSLRDRKVPIPPVERPQQRPPVPPRPNSPSAVSPATSRVVQSHDPPLSPSAKLSTGPQITTVRVTRKQTTGTIHTLTTKKSQVFNSSPLGTQTWKPGDESPTNVKGNVAVSSGVDPSLQTALETPLPPSPIERAWSGSHLSASTIPNAGLSKKYQSVMADIAGLQFTPLTDSFSAAADTLGFANGVETPTKKHYHGRPLPPAPGLAGPGIRPPIDSVYLTHSSPSDKGMRRDDKTSNNCPEGLLIDLDDNTFVSGMSTPEAARSQTDLRLPPPPASPTVTGFPMLGNGNGHRWHAASASMSTPNLASQPVYPSPLQIVNLTPNPSQGDPVPHVWGPLHAVTTEPQWGYDSETDDELPEYEVGSIGKCDTPQSLTHRLRHQSIGPNSQHHLHPKTLRLCHHRHI